VDDRVADATGLDVEMAALSFFRHVSSFLRFARRLAAGTPRPPCCHGFMLTPL
jgi:hypothetical protein